MLVDRVWPRGVNKDKLKLDQWLKDVAPSTDLRKWFGHDPQRWGDFKTRYFRELASHREQVTFLRQKASEGTLTLVFAARDPEHNNAVALKEYLARQD